MALSYVPVSFARYHSPLDLMEVYYVTEPPASATRLPAHRSQAGPTSARRDACDGNVSASTALLDHVWNCRSYRYCRMGDLDATVRRPEMRCSRAIIPGRS